MTFATGTAFEISTFVPNTDSVNDPALCGAKTYTSSFAPVTIVPGTSTNSIKFASNDYAAHVGLFTVTITVGFANFLPTLTQTFDLEILHPCKIT